MLRLFTCVWIPDDIKYKIIKLGKELETIPMKAKFVEPDNIHVTINFIGDYEENDMERLKDGIRKGVNTYTPFEATVAGLVAMPSKNYIRVLGVSVSGGTFSGLSSSINGISGGSFHENKKITICRISKVLDKISLVDFINKNENIFLGKFEVNTISLVKSTLTPKGPVYEEINSFKMIK